MYISKVFIDVNIPLVRRDLGSLNCFYDTLKKISGGGDPVYRIDNVPLKNTAYIQPVVLISENRPLSSSGTIPSGYIVKIETFEYNIPVRNGMVYKYYLKANPSVRMLFRHSDLETEESWGRWFETEGIINGFEIVDMELTDDGYVTCVDRKVKFVSVIFQGILKIVNEDKFRKALNSGIGRGREYGLGLLSVESFGCRNRNIAEEMKKPAPDTVHVSR